MKDSIDAVLSVYYAEIKTNQKLIKNLDKAITDIVQTLPEERILQSIPGIGSVYSAGIIAEIGSIDRFDTEAQLAKSLV
nr:MULTISPECIES: transposase [Lactobacillus]